MMYGMNDTGVTVRSRQRVQIRSRELGVTVAAWRAELTLADGKEAAIVFLDPWFRGEGALMGATQERLAEIWRATLPDVPPEPEPQQWG